VKSLVLILVTVVFLLTSVNVCLADKGRDPPDPPVAPAPEPNDRSLSMSAEKAPGAPAIKS